MMTTKLALEHRAFQREGQEAPIKNMQHQHNTKSFVFIFVL